VQVTQIFPAGSTITASSPQPPMPAPSTQVQSSVMPSEVSHFPFPSTLPIPNRRRSPCNTRLRPSLLRPPPPHRRHLTATSTPIASANNAPSNEVSPPHSLPQSPPLESHYSGDGYGTAAFRNSSHCYSVALHLVECHITAGTTILTSN